jgi:hypothetical protein
MKPNTHAPITTLTELLETTGMALNLYDMGRRVTKIPRDEFRKIELNHLPYPLPLQRQAWFGLFLSDPVRFEENEVLIWFIRFPLDEQAKLSLGARDDFTHRLLEQLGENLSSLKNEKKTIPVTEDGNTYLFKPRDDRLAVFHAKITSDLNQPPSDYYQHARNFFHGDLGWDQWSFIGYQGIADLAVRLNRDQNDELIVNALPHLPGAPYEALCHCLENEKLPRNIAEAIVERADTELNKRQPERQILSASIRGIAGAETDLRSHLIHAIVDSAQAIHSDLLAAIAGRAWEALLDETLRKSFLNQLAVNDQGQSLFDNLLSDLLFLPETRAPFLAELHASGHRQELDLRIERFLAQTRKKET